MKEWCSCPHLTKAPDEQPGGPGRDCWANYPTHFEQWSNWNDPDSVTIRSLNPLPLYQLCQRAGWKSVSQGLILPHGTVMVPEDILRSMWCFEQNKNVKKRKSTRGPGDHVTGLIYSECLKQTWSVLQVSISACAAFSCGCDSIRNEV